MPSALVLCSILALVSLGSAAKIPDIQNLQQVDESLESVTLQWSLSSLSPHPLKYTLLINGLLTQEFLPPSNLQHVVSGLSSCTRYSFKLTATFDDGVSNQAAAYGTTRYEKPGSVGDLTIQEDDLVWTMPANPGCIDSFEVCWTSTALDQTVCIQTYYTSHSVANITGCDHIRLTVRAMSPDGQKGPISAIEMDTEYGDPSSPINFEVRPLPRFRVELTWDYPVKNPACVKRFSITYGPYDNKTEQNSIEFFPHLRSDVAATLNNLSACTNYEFEVASLSTQDILSSSAKEYMETEYISPGQISGLTLVPSKDAITVQWAKMLQEPCLKYLEICYTDILTMDSLCSNVHSPDLVQNTTITGLLPCRTYEFVVVPVSKTDEFGPPTMESTTTLDVAPGPVTDLCLTTTGSTKIQVNYNEPKIYPECVDEYVITYKNLMEETSQQQLTNNQKSGFTDVISGLDPCALYRVEVYAKSISEKDGPKMVATTETFSQRPGEPRSPSFVTNTQTSLTIVWFAPKDRFCVDQYTVKLDEKIYVINTPNYEEELLKTFDNLTPCTTYIVNITSYNNDKGYSGTVSLGQQSTLC